MSSVYRRKVRVCTTCDRRLDTTAARRACEASGHAIVVRAQGPWWIRYAVEGRPQCVSSESHRKADAIRLLNERDGHVVQGPVAVDVASVRFEDAADDILNDYRTNKKRSLRTLIIRITKHLTPFFGGRVMAAINTVLVRQYVVRRQAEGASNATNNRDLIALKRMFSLAVHFQFQLVL